MLYAENLVVLFYIVAKLPISDSQDFAKFLLTDFNKDGKL